MLAAAAVAIAATVASAEVPPRSPTELLQWMDSDGDGRVGLQEYQYYLSRGFRTLDRNGDGMVDSSELPAGVHSGGRRKAVDLTRHERSLAQAFARQDVDHDGFLDAAELAAPPR